MTREEIIKELINEINTSHGMGDDPQSGGTYTMKKRKIKIRWSCSDFVHHEHHWKWAAYICGVLQCWRHGVTTLLKSIAILMLLAGGLKAQVYINTTQTVEYQCEICGKSIYCEISVEPNYFGGNRMNYTPSSTLYPVPDSLKATQIAVTFETGKICPTCAEKYGDIKKFFQDMWDWWLKQTKEENAKSRKMYEAAREKQNALNLQRQIDSLQTLLKGKP